ncbi:hypothetical protein [Nocardia sp. NPDC005366]|uniref:hypothetical protein n=1 Tax=Nocardia sp. NPDC005366 TaxID=3156878 RepID=UPI0033AF8733
MIDSPPRSVENGLFNDDGEFLLVVDYREPGDGDLDDERDEIDRHAWIRVRLLDHWDLVTSEVAKTCPAHCR